MSSRTIPVTLRSIASTFLYALTDPRPGDLHVYVGKADDPRRRFMEHYWELPGDHSRKAHWLRQLLALGLKPTQEILREVPFEEWEHWEREFIRWYRVLGWRVVNSTDGGDGVVNLSPEARARCAAGRRGKGHTPEARAAIGAAARGRPQSAETRAKQSAAKRGVNHPMFGKPHSPEHRAKISAAGRGRKLTEAQKQKLRGNKRALGFRHTPEARAAISAAFKGKPLSVEHRAKIAATKTGERNPMFGKFGASNPQFGKPLSPEHRAKISATKLRNKLTAASASASVTLSP